MTTTMTKMTMISNTIPRTMNTHNNVGDNTEAEAAPAVVVANTKQHRDKCFFHI